MAIQKKKAKDEEKKEYAITSTTILWELMKRTSKIIK